MLPKGAIKKVKLTQTFSYIYNIYFLFRYKTEIKETRAQRLLEGKADRSLISNILATWRDLKKLRERQEYIVTSTKLEIIVDDNDNTEEWEIEFNKYLPTIKHIIIIISNLKII